MIYSKNPELDELLSENVRRYPLMLPQDAVKLLYQRSFGPGHMISNRADCIERLRAERRRLKPIQDKPFFEALGNGYARLNLNCSEAERLADRDIAEAFIASARGTGKAEELEGALRRLERLCANDELPFSPTALEAYLQDYRAAGCPAVSHSMQYRELYAPAYRVLNFAELAALAEKYGIQLD